MRVSKSMRELMFTSPRLPYLFGYLYWCSESNFEHNAGIVSLSCKLLWKKFSRQSNIEIITLIMTLHLFNFFDRFCLRSTCHSLPPSRMFPSGSTCATKRLPRALPLSKNHCRDRTHRRPPFPSSVIQVYQHAKSWRAVDWVFQVLYCFQLGQNYFCSHGCYSTNTVRKDLEWTLHQTGWPDRRRQRNQSSL